MNPTVLITLLLLSLLGGAVSFPENGSNDILPKDGLSEGDKKHNEIEPDDTSSPQEDSSEESAISSAFLRLLMIMRMMRDSFNFPGIILLRMRFIRIEETSDETQTEGGDFNRTSDDNMPAVQNNTDDSKILLNEENHNSNEETEKTNNKQSIETNTEAPPPETGKEKESVETSEKLNDHNVQETEEVDHKENHEKLIPEVSGTTPLQTESTTEHPTDEKQVADDSSPSAQEPNYHENEIIPHEETKSNSERKGFFASVVDAAKGVFGYIFG